MTDANTDGERGAHRRQTGRHDKPRKATHDASHSSCTTKRLPPRSAHSTDTHYCARVRTQTYSRRFKTMLRTRQHALRPYSHPPLSLSPAIFAGTHVSGNDPRERIRDEVRVLLRVIFEVFDGLHGIPCFYFTFVPRNLQRTRPRQERRVRKGRLNEILGQDDWRRSDIGRKNAQVYPEEQDIEDQEARRGREMRRTDRNIAFLKRSFTLELHLSRQPLVRGNAKWDRGAQ